MLEILFVLSTFSKIQSLDSFLYNHLFKMELVFEFLALYWKTLLIVISPCFEKLSSEAFVVIILEHFAAL